MEGKLVILGVTGGIAAYKACDVASKLTQAGADVCVIMTAHAQEFVRPRSFEAITHRPVITSMFGPAADARSWEDDHIPLTDAADVLLIAPATANIIGKIANGIADDMLSTVALAFDGPTIVAPAMNFRMWEHPAVRRNMARLAEQGVRFVGPEEGRLASGAIGIGRLAGTAGIVSGVRIALDVGDELCGLKVLVTAGPTREWFDDVRFISNPSSGKMGYALAEAAARRGADVTLVTGPSGVTPPGGVRVVAVETAEEMAEAALGGAEAWDMALCAAAPADWRPERLPGKTKKTASSRAVELSPTRDTLAELGQSGRARVLIGFAAETEDLVANARQKAEAKRADLIVANDVTEAGAGFGSDTNVVTLVWPDGRAEPHQQATKREVAQRVLDEAVAIWRTKGRPEKE